MAKPACTATPTAQGTQTLRCETAITIVAENGAKFELRDRNRDGQVDSVELSNKALLLEVPRKAGRARFEVVTPQAIAAVRGTKWAVDAEGGKTSVFVVDGRVNGTCADALKKAGTGLEGAAKWSGTKLQDGTQASVDGLKKAGKVSTNEVGKVFKSLGDGIADVGQKLSS